MFDHNHFSALVEQHKDELLQLCSDLIKIPSVNPPGEMEAITSFICGYLDKHGISYEVLRPTPTTPNIVATLGRKGGRRLILNGHADEKCAASPSAVAHPCVPCCTSLQDP